MGRAIGRPCRCFAQLTRRMAFIPGSAEARFSLLYVEDLARFLAARLADDAQGLIEVDDGHGGYGWPDLLPIAGRARAGRRRRFTCRNG